MPRRLRKEKVPETEPEQDAEQEEENPDAMDYGVSEENHTDEGGQNEDKNGDENGDENEEEEDKEEEQEDKEGNNEENNNAEEEKEVAALDSHLVKEKKYKEIAEFFISCHKGQLLAAKNVVRKVLGVIYDKEDDEKRAHREKRKREREAEDARSDSEKKKRTVDSSHDDEYASFEKLPIDKFCLNDEVDDTKLNLVVLIPNGALLVGHIIGRGGNTVREAKNRSGADIRVESDKFLAPGTPDRRIAVRGTVKRISFAVQYILRLIKDKVGYSDEDPDAKQELLKFVVPDQSAGRLIGQKWANMKEMEQQTKTRLQVLGKTQLPSLMTGRVIQAQGSFEGCCEAFYLCARTVVEKIDYPDVWQTGDPTKDPSGRRDPPKGTPRGDVPPLPERVDRWDDRVDPRDRERRPFNMDRDRDRGRDRDRYDDLPPASRYPVQSAPDVDPLITAARMGGGYGARGGAASPRGYSGDTGRAAAAGGYGSGLGGGGASGASSYSGFGAVGSSSTTTTEIEIPELSVGFVFGRKGCQIREIRERSGARIDSSKSDTASNHRILAVAGSVSAVKMAVDMVNDLVLEWGRRERDGSRARGRYT